MNQHHDNDHDHSHDKHVHDEHDHHGHHHHHLPNNRRGLIIALVITAGIMVLEFFGGLVTNSLALLADSGHMLSDVGALALSLIAMNFALRPPTSKKSFGFYRVEILAALLNGLSLFVIAGFIIWEALERFVSPPTVASGQMMIIAAIGLAANIASAVSLMKQGDIKHNINVRSAYLHVIGDALGSVGALLAGLLMLLFSWYIADPIISVIVALLILRSATDVVKNAIHILMEGTPITIQSADVKQSLLAIEGVHDIHDLHIWMISSDLNSLTCHLLVDDETDEQVILQEAIRIIESKFNIQHTTIQIEKSEFQHPHLKF
jgi:cobalt-zinc-cadmium efflux system protein